MKASQPGRSPRQGGAAETSRAKRWLIASLLVSTAAGTRCVSHRIYRQDCVGTNPEYSLAYIERDDRGEVWYPRQFQRPRP